MAVRKYDIPCALRDGTPGFEDRYWSPVNSPILDDGGQLGMGLYIVHETVAAFEGSIEVASELGSGSTFVVRLPLRGPATEQRVPSMPRAAGQSLV